ncbi:MAG: ABC-2 type transport system permease protein [Rhodothermales bacterium]|jgi:ABC-2 type transport system permease protein
MRTIGIILRKEFRQIFRNRGMLPILFVMPVIQLLLLSFAATFEVTETAITVVDEDRSTTSRELVQRMEATGYFRVVANERALLPAEDDLTSGQSKAVLHFPRDMERDLRGGKNPVIQLIMNAEDGATAGIVLSYASQIIGGYNLEMVNRAAARVGAASSAAVSGARPLRIRVIPRHWFNPDLKYTTFMVPGILVILVTMIGVFLSAMNVVREKEIGTIEQLNVTPIKRYQFIIGKLLPFWVIALAELAVGLVIAKLVFDIPMVGSLALIFGLAAVYMLVMLGFGLLISTVTDTQQQAMFIAWFVMVVFLLLSGLFTPVESMPTVIQDLNRLNPLAYFIEIMRRVLLKGAGFPEVQTQFWSLVAYAAVVLSLAVRQHQKVTA